ncbi:peptidoglycan DD-metalloendopeptidase family protein [Halotia branconii]|uniref:Peptidoglycan DD-metalloendopeptidase family protein n=1 Tax=Halotia branconii CENA392 TaxID=1539056 RepID=A0AAJ6PBY2_9CYAN|nr:peptidoglycan DD-metalloendopeptidase family protein [Halotia branconii]WGV28409.1 peptidoglycan DD-metalloendopeptidase family protein [Halotia branconii CENA392]
MLKNTPSSDGAPLEQLNTVNPMVNRRVRTKAAMIGLAISMGATSLLVTRQSDQAQAAAPVGSQKAASTIPAASNTEMKFASTKLKTQIISSASVPENSVIVEPTAISQLPGLEAKWQVAAGGMSLSVPASDNVSKTTADKTGISQQSQLLQEIQAAKKLKQTSQQLSSVDGVAGGQDSFLKTQAQQSTVVSTEVNAQLKAQQEFALNRLQEKSNRLRKSLAELGSGESKNSSKAKTELAQATTEVDQLPPISTSNTVIEQSPTLSDTSKADLLSRLKQTNQTSESTQQVATAPVPATQKAVVSSTTKAYEVKPGDTLAAIASRYNTSVAELVKANHLSNPNQLKISQRLIIPAGQVEPRAIKIPVVANPVSNSPVSIVANNSSVTIPVPTVTNNQVEANTAIAPQPTPASVETDGVGGDTPMPKAFTEIQLSKKPGQKVARARNERLQSLQAEIQRLQEKYRAQQSGNVASSTTTGTESNSAAVPIPVPVAVPNNFAVSTSVSGRKDLAVPIAVPSPMASGYSTQPIKPEFRATLSTDEPVNPEFLPNSTAGKVTLSPKTSATKIATPPVGVNASDSLGRARGTNVSPNYPLPPLAAVDQYLPKPVDETIPPPSSSSVAYVWPAKGVFTSGYGWRWGRMHKGIDVANATGTPVQASSDGVVEKAGWNKGGFGNLVEIRHPDGSMTRYAHNSKILVRAGQQVRQGEIIAKMGSTGFSTGPHTHFEIHPSGKGAVNPIALLPDHNQNRI